MRLFSFERSELENKHIFQTLIFMFKVKNNMAPNIFNNNIKTITHKYPTKYSN